VSATPNPLMQQAAGMFNNPNAAAVPPAPQGVIDPTQHPVIKAIIQALSQAGQNFSMTAMDPRERMQRQEMEAQKAEALAKLGISQQQLGLEQQRTQAEVARSGAEAAAIPQRTKTEALRQRAEQTRGEAETAESHARTGIEQSRLNQEIAAHKDSVTQAQNTLKELEREHNLAHNDRQAQNRIEQQAQTTRAAQADEEKNYHQKVIQMQGLKDTYEGFENERKNRTQSVHDYYDAHPLLEGPLTGGAGRRQRELDIINNDINAREQAAGVATGIKAAGAGTENTSPMEFERKPDGSIGPKVTQGKQ
jgi:hypothetical protein